MAAAVPRIEGAGQLVGSDGEPPELFGTDGLGPNGIVWHPAGFLLVSTHGRGTLVRIPLHAPEHAETVALEQPIPGADGVELRPDGTLVVGSNGVISSGSAAVTVLRSTDGWASARTVACHAPWPDSSPSTSAVTPYGTYVLDGRLAEIISGNPVDGFTLRRLPD
ncbi:hypothetical protein HUT18_01235 [Streptomyces sp. NA04227]|uniref:hypothetical protein n=1 Tax=Streptomyces sp. NA04227 TaxID=2742136 RepID=UPI001590925B|nr:hypothetical protein [Streptomyces sp. NA04227]QKW05186.1 hypothetical protein HUT18_01235 [Streptomyces sp. NA04227]